MKYLAKITSSKDDRQNIGIVRKLLFTWLLLVMSLMVSFCAVFFPRVSCDLIESVSEGFPTYSCCFDYGVETDISKICINYEKNIILLN